MATLRMRKQAHGHHAKDEKLAVLAIRSVLSLILQLDIIVD